MDGFGTMPRTLVADSEIYLSAVALRLSRRATVATCPTIPLPPPPPHTRTKGTEALSTSQKKVPVECLFSGSVIWITEA